jgi:hypothetical protein
MVRYYVALYSVTAAEQYARGKGATDADIEAARRCIKVDTARYNICAGDFLFLRNHWYLCSLVRHPKTIFCRKAARSSP